MSTIAFTVNSNVLRMPPEPSQPSNADSQPNQPDPDIDELEQALAEVERSLTELKARYAQLQRDLLRKAELEQRLQQGKNQAELQLELRQIQAELKEIEVGLESRLLTDSSLLALFWQAWRKGLLGEVFWQIVRFGGLGVIIGWVLKSCTSS